MHHSNEVSVFTDGPRDHGESPAGVGWLMTPSVVVMRHPGRGATPGLPSHIAVPAVSGGGRDERVLVLGVHDSPELDGWVALQLDRDCDLPGTGTLPEGVELFSLSGSAPGQATSHALAADDGTLSTSSWLCRCFPSLPGCRR